ncbi:Frag1/DRAM/Sfk1 family-domain-containing protein [Sparassis latifolia]
MAIAYEHRYWVYAWIPLFGAFIWFGTLLSMLITWLATGRPRYVTQQGSIAYISDIGAGYLKPLFIVCCCITGVSFFLSLVVERWLRHSGRLVPNMRRRERFFSTLAILGAAIGAVGLILLSIFDTGRHRSLHRVFLLVFIVGVALSALFTIAEFRWISHDFVEIRKLKRAYIAKGVIAVALIILAIAFAVALYHAPNAGAIIEWVIAFGFTFYILTFYYDLRMARGVHKGELSEQRLLAMRQQGSIGAPMMQINSAGGNYFSRYRSGIV